MDVISYFLELVKIDSESMNELTLALKVKKDLEDMGAEVSIDDAGRKIGGNCGNLYAYLPGNVNKEPLLFCAHLDTVKPGVGIKPVIEGDVIKSDGSTILGADDKSGIAEIIVGIRNLIESGDDYTPIEILFTVAEEVGLLGAKYCDVNKIKAKYCFTFDSHEVGSLTLGAPSQNNLNITVRGKTAHAGVEPEKGINAILAASDALCKIPLGRIDFETTSNIGVIKGGVATNIVPEKVVLEGEVRSHDQKKLELTTEEICKTFRETVNRYTKDTFSASVSIKIENCYQAFLIEEDNPIVALARKTTEKIRLPFSANVGGGGSDANVFNSKGLTTVIIGTGMNDVHTNNENINKDSLLKGAEWVSELLRIYAKS